MMLSVSCDVMQHYSCYSVQTEDYINMTLLNIQYKSNKLARFNQTIVLIRSYQQGQVLYRSRSHFHAGVCENYHDGHSSAITCNWGE